MRATCLTVYAHREAVFCRKIIPLLFLITAIFSWEITAVIRPIRETLDRLLKTKSSAELYSAGGRWIGWEF